jgi:hypothetical protein
MKKERTIVLKTGTYFRGTHSPNWQDFDIIIKVTDKGSNTFIESGDVVKIPKSSIDFDIIKRVNAPIIINKK